MEQVYFERFSDLEDVCREFAINESELEGATILYACYDTPDYEGYAEVIFVKDGILYEAVGSHCSCNGLEECWSPEETSLVALLGRPNIATAAKKNLKEYYKNVISFL